MLEEEKRLLHHQIQMLSRQNCSLESALRKSGSTLEVTVHPLLGPGGEDPFLPRNAGGHVPSAAAVRTTCY